MAVPKSIILCLTTVLSMSMIRSFCEARVFVVGGKESSWEVPSSLDEFNKWAEKNRFEIGDSIVMKYDSKTDSVLEVTEDDYKTCDTSNPIKSHKNGNTKITFDKSGPFFFISGDEGHCKKGEKLEIKVLSAKHGHHTAAPGPSMAQHHLAPAPAPNGGSSVRTGLIGGAAVVGILALLN